MQKHCCHCLRLVTQTDRICPFCGQSVDCDTPSHQLLPGTVLRGRYYIGAALGQGGFGITYVGYDTLHRCKVAVKEYFPKSFVNRYNEVSSFVKTDTGPECVEFFKKGKQRFLYEAKILSGFSGVDGVVNVLDCFEENNTVYIVMEHLDGITLKQYLAQYGTLSAKDTLDLMTPVMNALKALHRKHLIHRDISPDNIMLTREGSAIKATLIDFGATRYDSQVANKSLTVILKPGFAPIEQYGNGEDQGAWTDIYALCGTMYQCLTGVTPQASLLRIKNDRLKPPSALGAKIGPYTEQAILKGMSVNVSDRYPDIESLQQALAAAVAWDRSAAAAQRRQPTALQTQSRSAQATSMPRQNGTQTNAQVNSSQQAASQYSVSGTHTGNTALAKERKVRQRRRDIVIALAIITLLGAIGVFFFAMTMLVYYNT